MTLAMVLGCRRRALRARPSTPARPAPTDPGVPAHCLGAHGHRLLATEIVTDTPDAFLRVRLPHGYDARLELLFADPAGAVPRCPLRQRGDAALLVRAAPVRHRARRHLREVRHVARPQSCGQRLDVGLCLNCANSPPSRAPAPRRITTSRRRVQGCILSQWGAAMTARVPGDAEGCPDGSGEGTGSRAKRPAIPVTRSGDLRALLAGRRCRPCFEGRAADEKELPARAGGSLQRHISERGEPRRRVW